MIHRMPSVESMPQRWLRHHGTEFRSGAYLADAIKREHGRKRGLQGRLRHHKMYGRWKKRTQAFVEKAGGRVRDCPQGQAKEGRKQGETRLQSLK